MLYVAAGVNLLIAVVLMHNNYWYQDYDVYHRSRILVAVNYTIFAFGFMLHAYFLLRINNPIVASALSVSYFHSGGVLFGWSHISLMRPNYLTRGIVVRDLVILLIGLTAYWTTALMSSPACDLASNISISQFSIFQPFNFSTLIFFFHASYIAYRFYRTFYVVRRSILMMPAGGESHRWWTPEAKRKVLVHQKAFAIGCHLIILFGIGSIIVTAAFPTDIWPYTLLTATGIAVFCYIFYALTEYGNAIEAGTNATEDALTANTNK